jgi:hypothetical protein
MNVELTTGQMIDQLKEGQIAESDRYDLIVTKENGRIKHAKENSYGFLNLNFVSDSVKWKIKPQYVTFAKAMQAVEEGKTAILHDGHLKGCPAYFHKNGNGLGVVLEFRKLLNGKWSIKE